MISREDLQALQAVKAQLDEIIKRDGWAHIYTTHGTGAGGYLYYTIGLTDLDLPELVLFGLDRRTSNELVTNAINELKQHKAAGDQIEDGLVGVSVVADFPVVLRDLPWSVAGNYVKAARERYRRKLRVMQLLLPDG